MIKYDKKTARELYRYFDDSMYPYRILLLGNKFDMEKDGDILNLRWSTVYTSIRDKKRIEEILEKIKKNGRGSELIEIKKMLDNIVQYNRKKTLVDAANLKVVTLFPIIAVDEKMKQEIDLYDARDDMENAIENIKNYIGENGGALFCIGCFKDDDEQLKIDTDTINKKFSKIKGKCIYVFGADESVELSAGEQMVLSEESLTELWKDKCANAGGVNVEDDTKEDEIITIYTNGKRKEIYEKNIPPFVEILDTYGVERYPVYHREERDFKVFLNNKDAVDEDEKKYIKWVGYARGFNVKRDFEEELEKKVMDALERPDKPDDNEKDKVRPILLCGPSGNGKTIALGNLAYKVFKGYKDDLSYKKFPVVYITDPNIVFYNESHDENDDKQIEETEEFKKLAEFLRYLKKECDARSILLIWDRSGFDKECNSYLTLFNMLRAQNGINVVVVGTVFNFVKSDERNDSDKYEIIEAGTQLSPEELRDFRRVLEDCLHWRREECEKCTEEIKKEMSEGKDGYTFLAMLYHVFEFIRDNLAEGIYSYVKYVKDNYIEKQKAYEEIIKETQNRFAELDKLVFDKCAEGDQDTQTGSKGEDEGETQTQKEVDDFFVFTALFTYFNMDMSVVLARNILAANGTEYSWTFFVTLNEVVFVSDIYTDGVKIRCRTRMEAILLLRYYDINIDCNCNEGIRKKSHEKIAKYLSKLLYYVEKGDKFGSLTESEVIECITKIIRSIGPNGIYTGEQWKDFNDYAPYFIVALRLAGRSLNDQRLMIQRLTLLREYNRDRKNNKTIEKSNEDFETFFADVRDADDPVSAYCSENIYSMDLAVEIECGCELLCEVSKFESTVVLETEIVNCCLELGIDEKKDGDVEIKKQEYVEKAAEKIVKTIEKVPDNEYVLVAYFRTNIAMLKIAEDKDKIMQKMLGVANAALHRKLDLAYRHNFVIQFVRLFDKNSTDADTVDEFAEETKSKITPALISRFIYSKLWKMQIIFYEEDFKRVRWIYRKECEDKIYKIYNVMDDEKYRDGIQKDSFCLYLKLQLYWLLNNKSPLNFDLSRQKTNMSDDCWSYIRDICDTILDIADKADKAERENFGAKRFAATCRYVQALANAQLGNVKKCQNISKKNKKRNNIHYVNHLICDENGNPKVFNAKVLAVNDMDYVQGKMMVMCGNQKVEDVYFTGSAFSGNIKLEDNKKVMLGLNFMGLVALEVMKS